MAADYMPFKETFDDFKNTPRYRPHLQHQWQFERDQDPSIVPGFPQRQIIKKYAGANFRCGYKDCGHEWFSKAHSTILFQYDPISHRIKWRKFGQKCRQCHRSEYHQAHYGDEQIERTIDYLLKKLILKVYNINLTVDPPQLNYNNNRGDDLACYCEACMSGNYCRKQD